MPFQNGTRSELIQSLKKVANVRQITSTDTLKLGYNPDFIVQTHQAKTTNDKDPTLIVKANDGLSTQPNLKIPPAVIQVPKCF